MSKLNRSRVKIYTLIRAISAYSLTCVFDLGLRSFISECKNVLRLSRKPTRRDIWLSIRIILIGLAIIGIVGFIIRLISTMFTGFVPSA